MLVSFGGHGNASVSRLARYRSPARGLVTKSEDVTDEEYASFHTSLMVENTGHINNEIDFVGSEGLVSVNIDNIKPRQIFSSAPLATWDIQAYKNEVHLLPKEVDEKVGKLHFPALRSEITVPVQTPADHTGVEVEGPFTPKRTRSISQNTC